MSLDDPEYFEWRQRPRLIRRSEKAQIAVELITLAAVCLASGIAIGAWICERVCTP